MTDQVLKILAQRGYRYDASTFPTFLGPLARAYYFAKSSLNRQDRQERKALFGRFQDGFQSLRPFFWQTGESRILEIPVTTMPIFKTPIHASYLLYLASFSQSAAKAYFWQAIQLCRLFRVQPSLLLHPLDFIGCELDPELAFFPGMNLPTETKTGLMRKFLRMYSDSFQVVSMRDHAAAAATDKRITQRPIQLARAGAEG